MIERYNDHAANERTFLAWVRTAIAIMAFGFLVEKFDLFLEIAGKSLAGRTPSVGGQLVGNIAGLLLIALGGATMVLAILRFHKTAIGIDSIEKQPGTGERMASTCPGPTEGSWSMSPTTNRAALSGTAFMSACISMTSTIDVSSTTNRSQSSGLSSPRLKPPPLGSTSSSRWMVLATPLGG
jgi:putative membrane protein